MARQGLVIPGAKEKAEREALGLFLGSVTNAGRLARTTRVGYIVKKPVIERPLPQTIRRR